MGGSQSTTEAEDQAFVKARNLCDQIENALTRELQDAIKNTSLNVGKTKEIYKKRSEEIVELQKKFSDYKKLIDEARTLSTTKASDLARSSEEYKQKTEKLNKDIKDLEETSSRSLSHQKKLTNELAQKLKNEERKLKDETEFRQKAESELLQMTIYKEKCETHERKIKKLEEELKETEMKLQEAVKLKIEQQFQQHRYTSESSDVLRNTVESQMETIEQLQTEQKEKHRELEKLTQSFKELQTIRNVLQRDVISKSSTINFYKKQADALSDQLQALKKQFEEETASFKKQDETKQELTLKKQLEIEAVSNKQKDQIAKQKQQIDRLTMSVKELEKLSREYKEKLEEKQVHVEAMYQEIEDFKEVTNFLTNCLNDPEVQTLLMELKEAKENLTEAQKQNTQTQFQLNILEGTYNSLKRLCQRGLKETKHSLQQLKKDLQESRKNLTGSEESKTIALLQELLETKHQEVSDLQKQLELKEKKTKNPTSKVYWNKRAEALELQRKCVDPKTSVNVTRLEELLERRTHEIAELKNQLKAKDDEMKKFGLKEYWNTERGEILELQKELMQHMRVLDDDLPQSPLS